MMCIVDNIILWNSSYSDLTMTHDSLPHVVMAQKNGAAPYKLYKEDRAPITIAIHKLHTISPPTQHTCLAYSVHLETHLT